VKQANGGQTQRRSQLNGTTPFAVSHEQRGALPLLHVHGELDIEAAPRLKEAILAALHPDARSLAIDFSGVEFMDSTGLQVLMSATKRTAERGGALYVVGVRDQVRRVFYLLGLARIFVLCRDLDLPQL
jgi:anti-sigma B factor antagonist